MFPFRFDYIKSEIKDRHDYYKDNPFETRVNINSGLKNLLKEDAWEYEKFEIKTSSDYNEFAYFHDFARDTFFNMEEFKEKATSYYFHKKIKKDTKFRLTIKDAKEYELDLKGLSLRLFDTGIAILSIELENYKYSKIDEILKINNFGRRVYPQFLGDNFTQETKDTFLADKIEIDGYEIENFNYAEVPKDIKIAEYILDILGENSFTTQKEARGKYLIQPSVDDRMFVLSWYKNKELTDACKSYKYKDMDRWYEYVFVDGNTKTIYSSKMQKSLVEESTYDRWMDAGTLYGISRYSFVCLADSDFTLTHIKTMYFQMFTLLLAQRATILRFSDEVTALSNIDEDKIDNQISNLYKNYIRFVNKLYFREVTPQDQGLEIYNQARKILKIDDDIKDLDNEIDELHRYATMLEDNKRTRKMDSLSKLGYIFLPPTFIAGFFGMNTFSGLDNIGGFLFSLACIVCSTYYVVKHNDIKVKNFFIKDKNE